jgi:hypothetical protein
MIDRLVHHAEILALNADSYRLKDRDLARPPPARTPETARPITLAAPAGALRRRLRASIWSPKARNGSLSHHGPSSGPARAGPETHTTINKPIEKGGACSLGGEECVFNRP